MSPSEAQDAFDQICPTTLRAALGMFATGVAVMTTMAPARRVVGLTANSFSSVSLEPPLVLWSLAKKSPNRESFEEAGYFAVNILTAEQADISSQFARPLADKFRNVDWEPGINGVPVISDCVASFECRLRNSIDGGDHMIFIGEILRFNNRGGDPLLFLGSRYHRAMPLA
ncbi:flavin reductase family protein [Eoetvoesiella caeni]|uniref:flavin reductase family protein n=1 Tax=Eoetvoesiella caeni TaxID=645616 RepID=UPI001F59DB36|nr:flavin reductase family protein [Eoetvoesiella caeni]MCI2808313.1 flavin reductase family protein [Eoetvoesiella caeni]